MNRSTSRGCRRRQGPAALLPVILCSALAAVTAGTGPVAAAPIAATPWTAAEPDQLVRQSAAAARAGGGDALARLVLIAAVGDQAAAGGAARALRSLGGAPAAVRDQGAWLARRLRPEPPGAPWSGVAGPPPRTVDRTGLVRRLAVLGPFEDVAGGLERREGPELPGHDHLAADYSWGAYTVRYVQSLFGATTPRGLDLDLYVRPRQESCTYLESAVSWPRAAVSTDRLVLLVASAGSLRVSWDGRDVARREEQHRQGLLDRIAIEVPATAGEHLLLLKVCSGAIADDGRVRARFVDLRHRPVAITSSADLGRLKRLAADLAAARAVPVAARQRQPVAPAAERPTLLDQALDVGPVPSPRRALVAAVLRTLGGAEDLRSPRAPGLLDRAVQGAPLRPDELAMAGFVAPAGADRSSRLAAAYQRARGSGDSATASFAQRALTAARLRARLVEHAAATARAAPLATATDPQARLLRALVLAEQGGGGAEQGALDELRAVAAARGAATPVAVWQAIARLSKSGPADLHLRAHREVAARRPGRRGPEFLAAHQALDGSQLERAVRTAIDRQRDAGALVAAGELLLESGRYRGALDVLRLATRLSPNTARAHRGLARAELAAASDGAAQERAVRALERAKRLEPQDATVAAELAFRQPAELQQPPQQEDERFLVEPAVFLERRRRQPARLDGQFERELHFLRVVRLHPDRRVSQLIHYAREILVEPRSEAERYERLPALSRQSELVLARVHRPDGTTLPPEEQETPRSGMPSVRWPKLRRGDVVEVALRAWTPGPIGRRGEPPFYFVDYVGSVETRPVLYNEVVIDAPDGGLLSFDVINGAPDRRVVERRGDRTITRLVWDAPPTIPDEPFRPPQSELLPIVVGSGFANWDRFVAWYRGAVEGFTEPDEQIRRLAADLTKPVGGRPLSQEQKLARIFEFVADDIRYVNYVSGEWWLPNRPQHLLARRQGDCDDKAMLLIALLDAVGIDAVEALVQTRLVSQPAILRSERVAIPMFDHGIAYLPEQEGLRARFLDATNPDSRLGPIVSMDSGAMVLLMPPTGTAAARGLELPAQAMGPDGGARVMQTPEASAADHGATAAWTVALSADGEGLLEAEELHVGDAALLLRTHLREADARAQWVEQHLLAGWLPTVEVLPEVSFEGELTNGEARLAYRARSRLLARREGRELVVSIAPPMPWTARIAPQPTRQLPVLLPPSVAPRHHHLTVRFEAPPGYRFADLPPDIDVDGGEFGRARQTFSRAPTTGPRGGQVVVLTREISFEPWRIAPDVYGRWRRWLQRIDRMLRHGVRLVPR